MASVSWRRSRWRGLKISNSQYVKEAKVEIFWIFEQKEGCGRCCINIARQGVIRCLSSAIFESTISTNIKNPQSSEDVQAGKVLGKTKWQFLWPIWLTPCTTKIYETEIMTRKLLIMAFRKYSCSTNAPRSSRYTDSENLKLGVTDRLTRVNAKDANASKKL